MNVENLWKDFLSTIKEQISSLAYTTWFENAYIYSVENKTITISTPTHIHKKQLKEKYNELIEKTFNDITGTIFIVEYATEEELSTKKTEEEDIGVPFYSNNETNLNPKYEFDNFILGNSNYEAHAAAFSVADNPGKMYNPLFIYGNSGLGKTHLMHAIGNYIIKNSNKKVLYVTSEKFKNDFVEMNKKDSKNNNFSEIDLFKKKYRDIDVLIIDDIQFLGGAPRSQEEFFHTFNELHDSNRQIIISSDRSPNDLKILEDRLRTRFNWGLTVSIYPPEFDLRVNILKRKIASQNLVIKINDEVIDYIAVNVDNDIRQLEGALTRICAYSTIFNIDVVTKEVAEEALKDSVSKSANYKNDIQKIQRLVADYYKISIDELKSKKRTAIIAYPRQIAMYLCRILTDESFPKIGVEFGGRDHSTVIHAVDKITKEEKSNPDLAKIIEKLKQDFK